MTPPAGALLALTLAAAVVDWTAVGRGRRRVEYVAKPLTLAALVATAVALDPADAGVRSWFVAALVLSLVGDVLLMLPSDRFVAGLVAFLLAHVAYVAGLVTAGLHPLGVLAGLVAVAVGFGVVGTRLLAGVRRAEPALTMPVAAYTGVISAMVVCAFGTGDPAAVAGALAFYASDALIAWTRFVGSYAWGRTAVMVTYHVGQVLLVLSLV